MASRTASKSALRRTLSVIAVAVEPVGASGRVALRQLPFIDIGGGHALCFSRRPALPFRQLRLAGRIPLLPAS